MRNQIIILAAGKGTRMGTGDLPKVLVMLRNKPLILHLLQELEKISQLVKSVVVVGYRHADVMNVLGDGYEYAFQDRQLGTGHAVMCAEKQVRGESVLVLYGDMPFIRAESLRRLMQLHHGKQAVLSMFTALAPNFENELESLGSYGRIIRDRFGNIAKITEYKDATEQERGMREVNPGIYMFRSAWLFDHVHELKNMNAQGEYYLTDMVELAIRDGQKIESLHISPKEVLGVNTQEQLSVAEKILQE